MANCECHNQAGYKPKNGDFAQDDILDDADQRRQQQTMHRIFGPDVAVLSGDFLFAHVTWRWKKGREDLGKIWGNPK